MTDAALHVPEHLVPLELERELIAGAFKAVDLLTGEPRHEEARRALAIVAKFDPDDLVQEEHQQLLKAMQHVLTDVGTLSPALVLDELRRRGDMRAIRLLPDAVTYGCAPVVGLRALARRLWRVARQRDRYRSHTRAAASILEGGGD